MPAARQDAQALYSTHTFRRLLDASARPGKLCQLAYPHFLAPAPATPDVAQINMYALGVLLSLLDRETSFGVAAHRQWLPADDALIQWIALRSGSTHAAPEQATFALLCDAESGAMLRRLKAGTLLEPEGSTTAFYCVEQLAPSKKDLTLALRGPGIETSHTVDVRGLSRAHIEEINASRRNYPLGVDVYLIDGDGCCLGLPRTTRINT